MLPLGGVWGQGMSPVTSLRSSGVDVHTAQPENVRTSQLQVGETYLLSTQLACLTGFFYDYFFILSPVRQYSCLLEILPWAASSAEEKRGWREDGDHPLTLPWGGHLSPSPLPTLLPPLPFNRNILLREFSEGPLPLQLSHPLRITGRLFDRSG